MPPRGDLGNSSFNPTESQRRKEHAAKVRGASAPRAPKVAKQFGDAHIPAGKGHEFRAAGERMIQGAMAGLYQSALEIFKESQVQVPVDTATLKASGRVNEPFIQGDKIICELGYGYGEALSPKTGRMARSYAIPVHERGDQYHEPPTKFKFLEDPVVAYIRDFEPTLAAHIQRAEKMSTGELRTFLADVGGGHA